jgi:hypothetical protein
MSNNGRHELKHYINYADYLQLHSRLPLVAKRDNNATEDNCYRVRSLYFDNYTDRILREKIDGLDDREKFRIRLYKGDTSFIRLEKKSKHRGFCFKESTVISADECSEIIRGNYSVLKENGKPLCLELYTKMHYQQLRPKSIVDYNREAYVYAPGNVRITIDSDIRGSTNISEFLSPEIIAPPIPNTTILEVKYDAFLPEMIRNMTSLQSRQAAAFSKYGAVRTIFN